MVKVYKHFQMVIHIQVNLIMGNVKVKEFLKGKMEKFMKGNLKMINLMAKVYINGKMEIFMKENFLKGNIKQVK